MLFISIFCVCISGRILTIQYKKRSFSIETKSTDYYSRSRCKWFFYSVIRFTLFALGLQLSIGYIYIFFFTPTLFLCYATLSWCVFFSVSQNSAHVKWNNGICFCQASGFRIVSIKRFCPDKEYMEFYSCVYIWCIWYLSQRDVINAICFRSHGNNAETMTNAFGEFDSFLFNL